MWKGPLVLRPQDGAESRLKGFENPRLHRGRVVVGQGSGSHPVIVSVTKNLNPEISAGNILKEVAAAMGGKGGGRPDFAQGAAPDRTKIKEAFAKASSLLGT